MPAMTTSVTDRDAEFATALKQLLVMGEAAVNTLNAFGHYDPVGEKREPTPEVREEVLGKVQDALNVTRVWLKARMDAVVPASAAPMTAKEWVERVSHDAAVAAQDDTGVAPQLLSSGMWRAARDGLSVRVAGGDEAADRKWCADVAQDAARRAGANAKVDPEVLLPAFLRTVEALSGLDTESPEPATIGM